MVRSKVALQIRVVPVILVVDALPLADVAGVVFLDEVVVELRRVVEAGFAELAPGVSCLP